MVLEKNNFVAGKLEKVSDYEVYIPNSINREFKFNDNKTLKLLEEASFLLCKLDFFLDVPFVNTFTTMLVKLEAYCSNAIEGTNADIKDVLDAGANINVEQNENIKKIINLMNLMETTYDYYNNEEEIFSVNGIEKIHKSLFKNIDNKGTYYGKIRKIQNYIGSSMMSALYVPPPPELVEELLNDLNDFWNDQSIYLPNLIKIALFHFQFETIHPFCDGNGRVGRMLINLQLKNKKMLHLPVLCLSEYWHRHKGLYYDALTIARFSDDIEYWLRFFLQSIITTCNERIETIEKILEIQKRYTNEIRINYKSYSNHEMLFNHLISVSPFITVKETQKILKITYQGANKIIENFVNLGILQELNTFKRNREFIFKEFFDLVFKNLPNNL